MAAAEYYNPSGVPPQGRPPVPNLAPQQQQGPRPSQSQNNLQAPPYPLADGPPPPYAAYGENQRPHSQPPPQQRIPQNQQQYQPYNPSPPQQNMNTHQYPPDKTPQQRPSTLQNMYRPSEYTSSYPPPQPQPNGNFPPQGIGAMSQVYGNANPNGRRPSSSPAYPPQIRYDNASRSRSQSRDRRHRHHNKPHPEMQRKKSSGVNTFLGAGGGAIIGDLIFPGLGTLGGALIGGVGGHEYSKKRAHSNPARGKTRSYSNGADYYDDDYRRGRK